MPSPSADPASRKRLALVAAILASAIAALDASAVNVALPAIGRDLGGGLAAQQWIVDAYLLTLSALILLAGSLTDRFGERRIFVTGVAWFGAASLLCAAAPTSEVLIGARALQGVGGALLTPSALAIIVAVFPREERGTAIGTWTAFGGLGLLVGPLIGGQIVDVASWRWIFLLNLPFVAGALFLAARAVPGRSGKTRDGGLDLTGAALAALGLAGLSFGLIEQPDLGWTHAGVLVSLAGGAALLVLFVVHEARTPDPMMPLSLFRIRNFAVANAQTLAMYGGIGVFSFFLTIYLQQVAGYSAFKAGLTGLVPTVMMFLLSRAMGRLSDRFGPRFFLTAGPLCVAAGFALMLRFGTTVSFVEDVMPMLLVFSFGLALTVSPLTATVLADADETDAGIASAINNAIARTASLLAVAAVGAVASAHYASALEARLPDGLPAPSAAAVQQAKQRTFAPVDPAAVPPAQRASVRSASLDASNEAFHIVAAIGVGLLVVAGAGGLLIRNPGRPRVHAAECPAGQITGAPSEIASEAPA